MQYLAHRGFWKKAEEQNTLGVFEKAFAAGYGIEFDIRDAGRRLIVSHDMPAADNNLLLKDVFEVYKNFYQAGTLAINIKADGLLQPLKEMLTAYGITNYFLFDMSIPESIRYMASAFTFFSRQSEYEPQPYLYDACAGVWLDCFKDVWYNTDVIKQHLEAEKKVAIVSPDLHKREYHSFWKYLKGSGLQSNNNLLLCTDFPDEAESFFAC
jgi:hypothetical protein